MKVNTACLWAKTEPYEILEEHLINTGLCAKTLLTVGVLRPDAAKLSAALGVPKKAAVDFASYIAALHDIGKAHPFFQTKADRFNEELSSAKMISRDITPEQNKNFRHELFTKEVLKRIWGKDLIPDEDLRDALLNVLSLHHQGKDRNGSDYLPQKNAPEKWEKLQDILHDKIFSIFSPDTKNIRIVRSPDALIYLLMGIVILSDWLASDMTGLGDEIRLEEREKLIIAEIEKRGLIEAPVTFPDADFLSLFPDFAGASLRGLQEQAEILGDIPAPLYIIEAPMGEGKTETAFYLAAKQIKKFGKNGFYAALPTSATGNQMYFRTNRFLSAHGMEKSRLLHSTAWLVDEYTPENCEADNDIIQWLAPLRRGLLSQFAVGTVDQVMMSVMKVRYGVIRLTGLANKVLILDEIHAYDTYMQTIIEQLLTWCKALGTPVIMLSATLPEAKKRSLLQAYGCSDNVELSQDYPLITAVHPDCHITQTPVGRVTMKRDFRISLLPCADSVEQTAQKAVELTENGGCLCVIVNTVNKAQTLYTAIKNSTYDGELQLFHARFPAEKRQQIENTVVGAYGKNQSSRPKKAILISTQVMEQSIDADFDVMISDMAPIDLLLQRMGRLHRFADTARPDPLKEPRIYVLTSPDGYDRTSVYADILLRKTENFLAKNDVIHTPEDMRMCIDSVYSDEDADNDLFEKWAEEQFRDQINAAAAQGAVLHAPNEDYPYLAENELDLTRTDDEFSVRTAKTRIGDGSIRMILLNEDEYEAVPEYPDKKTAQAYMKRSAAVSASLLPGEAEKYKYGNGLLKGMMFVCAADNTVHWGNKILYNDEELGIVIKRSDEA